MRVCVTLWVALFAAGIAADGFAQSGSWLRWVPQQGDWGFPANWVDASNNPPDGPPDSRWDCYVENGGMVTVASAPAECANLFLGGLYFQWEEVPVPVVGRESTVAVYTALTVGGTLEVGGAGGELSCTGRPRVINYRKRRQRYGSPSLRCQFPICFRDGCTRSCCACAGRGGGQVRRWPHQC
jgi:hypothetical protein